MKIATPILVLTAIAVTASAAIASALVAPFGYGRNATGGTGGAVTTVTTRAELDAALGASGSTVILVSGTITFGAGEMISRLVTDKTIIGLPGAKLVSTEQSANGGILEIKDNSNNVIIRNLVFEGPGAYDVDGKDLLFVRGTNVWVDHCEFYDGVDGNFDISNKGDNITATWNKFGYNKPAKAGGSGGSDDHRFSNLISGGDNRYPDDERYSVTLAYNWWGNGVKERMPRARNSQLHLLNNYVNTNVSSSKAIGLSAGDKGTDVYVENCHFKSVGRVLDASYGGSPKVTIIGSDRDNGNTNGGTSKPTYAYTAIPWQDVEAAVTGACGAGATLSVNAATGAVSCGTTGIQGYRGQGTEKVKTSVLVRGRTLSVSSPSSNNFGGMTIRMIDVRGKVVSRFVGANSVRPLSLSLTNIPAGRYFVDIRGAGGVKQMLPIVIK